MTLIKLQILLCLFIFSLTERRHITTFLSIRHGSRVPMSLNKDNKDSLGIKWNDERGLLTTKGKAQQFELGKWFGNKYKKYMNNGFDEKTNLSSDYSFYVSPLNRTIESYHHFLNGLNSELTGNISHKVQILARNDSYFQAIIVCKYDDSNENLLLKEHYKQFYLQYKDLFQTHVSSKNFTETTVFFKAILHFWDVYLSDYDNNPDLLKEILKNEDIHLLNKEISEYSYKYFIYNLTLNDSIKGRLFVKHQLSKLIDLFEYHVSSNGRKSSSDYPKILFNIGHDVNISAFLQFLLFNFKSESLRSIKSIDFASFISFNLYSYSDNLNKDHGREKFIVSVEYNKNEIMNIPYVEFLYKAKKYLVTDEEYDRLCLVK